MEPPGQMGGYAPQTRPDGSGQSQIGVPYVPTEDEKRVLRECSRESFWYRSLPISASSMFVTQILIKKGILTTHSRFGSLPKVAFAGFCGYICGNISYMKVCQEKLKRLDNSPLGEALRRRSHEYYSQKSGVSNVPFPFESGSVAEAPHAPNSSKRSLYEPVPFSSSMNESSPTGITDGIPQEPASFLEEGPKRKGITYDELRSRNREMYEAGITQKSEFPSKTPQGRPLKTDVKVNKYGDAWEE